MFVIADLISVMNQLSVSCGGSVCVVRAMRKETAFNEYS